METKTIKRKFSFWDVVKSLASGLRLTWKHFRNAKNRRTPEYVTDKNYFNQPDGLVTLKYPYEAIPVPDNGRYRLHNEIDDCIVCDLCAKICPVNCITIESVKATEEIAVTSDGTKKTPVRPGFRYRHGQMLLLRSLHHCLPNRLPDHDSCVRLRGSRYQKHDLPLHGFKP